MTSCIEPSVRIVTKSPKVGPLLIFPISLVQELQSLKEQVSSRQASYDQMVAYQKELQSRLDHQVGGEPKNLATVERFRTVSV